MSLSDKLRQLSRDSRSLVRPAQTSDLLELAKAKRRERPLSRTAEQASLLKAKLKAGRKDTTPEMSETKRICALPIEFGMGEEALERYNYDTLLASAYDSGFRLWSCQADAMSDYVKYWGWMGEDPYIPFHSSSCLQARPA